MPGWQAGGSSAPPRTGRAWCTGSRGRCSRKNGEGLLCRPGERCRGSAKEGYWPEAVAITTPDSSFGPTEISWLEHRLHNLAVKTGRYEVRNASGPTPGNITEEKESELEEFTGYSELAVGVLGCKALTPVSSSGKEPAPDEAPAEPGASGEGALLHLGRTVKSLGLKLDARGKQTAEGFAVLKGSVISPGENSRNISATASRRLKEAWIEGNVLQEDLLSGTPSAAASSVIGNSVNGWVEWKAGDGRTLKDLEQAE